MPHIIGDRAMLRFTRPACVSKDLTSRTDVPYAWWFEGDGVAAKDAWRRENEARGRYLPDSLWEEVVAVMDTNRQLLIQVFGQHRMLRTVGPGPAHVSAEAIHAAIFGDGREAA